jgi:3-keto-L-gulonate-6-phosphate decarboxylase
MASTNHAASARVLDMLRTQFTFQISVDTDNLPQAYVVADAAIAGGITLLEMGTPLLKTEGVRHVVPAFRQRYPDAIILADMKSMDGAGFEARGIYKNGGNIIDFLAMAGVASAKNVAAARDEFRASDPSIARLAFADILVPQQGPANVAVDTAQRMRDAGMDGVGLHLQLDARRADPSLHASSYLSDIARAVFEAVGDSCSVQVVGGLTLAQAKALAKDGLRAFVISGNFGLAESHAGYGAPAEEQTRLVKDFIAQVSAA